MKKIERKLLLAEAEAWVREGLIDEALLARLEARYAEEPVDSSSDWRSVVFFSVGALLVGLGLSALVIANLGNIRPAVAFPIASVPLVFCVAAWWVGRRKGVSSWAFWEPVGIFWGVAVVVGAMLAVSPLVDDTSHREPFFLRWVLLLLPVLYATRSLTVGVAYFIGLVVWVAGDHVFFPPFYWLLLLLGLPMIWMVSRESSAGVRRYVLQWGAMVTATIALGFTLAKITPGLWIIAYGGAFTVLLLAGLRFEADGKNIWQTPMRSLGGAGLAVLNFILIFQWPWRDIGWYRNRYMITSPLTASSFDYALAILLPLAALVLIVFVWRHLAAVRSATARAWSRVSILVWGLTPVMLAVAYYVMTGSDSKPWDWDTGGLPSSLICTVQLVLLGLTTVAAGLACKKLLLVSLGTAMMAAAVYGKIFADEYSLLARGIVFTVCGILLFAANGVASWFLKRAKRGTGA